MSNENIKAEEITLFVIKQALNGVCDDENENSLVTIFNLSVEQATWVRDRVFGGIYRAGIDLGSWFSSNKPDPKDDIFAYTSYQYVLKKPEIITTIYPFFGQKNAWWKFW